MKKFFLTIILLIASINLFACGSKDLSALLPSKTTNTKIDDKLEASGYYIDTTASMSDARLGALLEKTELMEKPKNMGTIELPDFSNIELISMKQEEVTDAMVEAELERERDNDTVYTPLKVKREVKPLDKLVIDYKLFLNGEPFEGGEEEGAEIILNEDGSISGFIPGFGEKLVGHKAGTKFMIDVPFPEEYPQAPELVGQNTQFEIMIKSIEEATTPEINEEFVKKHSTKGSTTVEEYKEEVRKRIVERQKIENDENLGSQLFQKLMEQAKFTPTEEANAWCFSFIIDTAKKQAADYGMDLTSILTTNGSTLKEAYENLKAQIPNFVHQEMLMDKLLEKYGVNVTENDVREYFDSLKSITGMGYDDYLQYAGYDSLLNELKFEKAIVAAAHECKAVEEPEETEGAENNDFEE